MPRRLATVAPDLDEDIATADPVTLRRVTQAVSEAALRATLLEDARAEAALRAVESASFGDSDERQHVKELEVELDSTAWDIQDRVELGDRSQEQYLEAFRRARAASTLWFALDEDPLHAAAESTYEAISATDASDIITLVKSNLIP